MPKKKTDDHLARLLEEAGELIIGGKLVTRDTPPTIEPVEESEPEEGDEQ